MSEENQNQPQHESPTHKDEGMKEETQSPSTETPKAEEQPKTAEEKRKANVEILADPVSNVKGVEEELPSLYDLAIRHLAFMDVVLDEYEKRSESYPKVDAKTSDNMERWSEVTNLAVKHASKLDIYKDTAEREDALWRQKVPIDGEELGPSRPRYGSSSSGVLSGQAALAKINNALGLGATVQIPLWHSGIWVTLKTPTESALLELERRLMLEKEELGRYTFGMAFSNRSVYTTMHLVNFVIDHIYDASVKNITKEYLKSHIRITDIPLLAWGLACAIYPSGYKYARPCTAKPDECGHITTGEVSLGKLIWTDTQALTEQQRRHMSRRAEKIGDDKLKDYTDSHSRGGPFTFTVNDNIKVRLATPSIREHENSGYRWIDDINRLLEGSLGVSLKGDERDNYIKSQILATTLRQYGHWIKEIEVEDELIEDNDTIESVLSSLSYHNEIRDKIINEVGKYIDAATISFIAIPKYDCPNCGQEQQGDIHNKAHPQLIPIDALQTFFTLLVQRTQLIRTERSIIR